MNYIYLGLADLYLPAAAAAIHLQKIKGDSIPTYQELLSCPGFRVMDKEDDGRLIWIGQAGNGDNVYIAAVKEHPEIFMRAAVSLLAAYHAMEEVKVIPCMPENPQIGYWCCRLKKLGLVDLANRLGALLVRNRFGEIKNIVNHL
ncbi:MAG: DUF3189 family protein [Firmicutes bacterium]|nr:DUF3189 family protein [Bacillota bacterium]